MYIYCLILSLIFIIAGVCLLKKPMKYNVQMGEWSDYDIRRGHLPCYKSKRALSNEKMWFMAQRIYGKYCLAGGMIYLLVSLILIPLFKYVCNTYLKKEDASIPFLLVIVVPYFCIIIWTRARVEKRLRKSESR